MTLTLSVSLCKAELGNYISRLELDEIMLSVAEDNNNDYYNKNRNKNNNNNNNNNNNSENNEYSYIEVEESLVNSADDVDRTWAGYYGSFSNNDASSLHNKSSTSERVATLIKSNFSMFWARSRVRTTKAIFGSSANKQFNNIRFFVLQAVFLKPALLAVSSYLKAETDYVALSKFARVSACLTLVVSMVSLLYYYNVLRLVLKDTNGGQNVSVGRQIFLLKLIVIVLALQYMVVDFLEATGQFSTTFGYRTYSDTHKSVRLYCFISIVEMAVLSPVFGRIFREREVRSCETRLEIACSSLLATTNSFELVASLVAGGGEARRDSRISRNREYLGWR